MTNTNPTPHIRDADGQQKMEIQPLNPNYQFYIPKDTVSQKTKKWHSNGATLDSPLLALPHDSPCGTDGNSGSISALRCVDESDAPPISTHCRNDHPVGASLCRARIRSVVVVADLCHSAGLACWVSCPLGASRPQSRA